MLERISLAGGASAEELHILPILASASASTLELKNLPRRTGRRLRARLTSETGKAEFDALHWERFLDVNQQFPPGADPAIRRQRPKTREEPTVHGLAKRYNPSRKFKEVLPFASYVPPGGYVVPPKPEPTEFYHVGREPVWYSDPGPNPLDVNYMITLARKHFSPEKAAYAEHCFRTGFLDAYTGPPFTQALTANRIKPGDPGTEELGKQLVRIASIGKLWYSNLPVPGTRVLPVDVLEKVKPDGTAKLRITCNGKYPGAGCEPFSRKGWTPRANVAYSQESIVSQMGRYVFHPPRTAFVSDLENAFEGLHKHKYEINGNCLRWDPGPEDWASLVELAVWSGYGEPVTEGECFWYSGVHLFGMSATPAGANLSFGLVALEQLEIARSFDPHATLSRRTDDTMVTFTQHTTDEQVLQCGVKCFEVNKKSGHKLQHKKTEHNVSCPRFDGFIWDFEKQRVGLPDDKGKSICKLMKDMLGSAQLGRTRTIAESLQGKLEHCATAIPFILKLLVAFRHCWMKLKEDEDAVTLTEEARGDLQRLVTLLEADAYRMWCSFGQHFVESAPAVVFATDASGLPHKGFGGYVVPGPRTLEPESISLNTMGHMCATIGCNCGSFDGSLGKACCKACRDTGPCKELLHPPVHGQRCARDELDCACITPGCMCVSFDGSPNRACSDVCAEHGACAKPYHVVPFRCPRPARAAGARTGTGGPKAPTFFALDTKWKEIVPDTAVITEDRHSSGLLELIAAYAMIETSDWRQLTLLWKTDSKVARDAWRKGRSTSLLMNSIIKKIAFALAKRSCVLVVEHLSRTTPIIQNADHLSRQHRTQFSRGLKALGRSQQLVNDDFRPLGNGLKKSIYKLLSTVTK